jgi:hypothetical protein
MTIGLIDVDGHNFPNLALMKLSAWHKKLGDHVEWYDIFGEYDRVYMAKVFTFTPDYYQVIANADKVEKGGTGYDIRKTLPLEIDRLQPDYSIYNIAPDLAYGFLTRGCPNKCKWCVVPQKEGAIRPYMDIEEIAKDKRKAILMDNNVIASDYGLQQIEKIVKMGLRVDFNQALDARLVTDEIAALLAKVHWIRYVRFGCDTTAQIAHVEKAASLMNKHGYKGEYFLYCILMDFQESYSRINHWRGEEYKRFKPYAQPYRPLDKRGGDVPNTALAARFSALGKPKGTIQHLRVCRYEAT